MTKKQCKVKKDQKRFLRYVRLGKYKILVEMFIRDLNLFFKINKKYFRELDNDKERT